MKHGAQAQYDLPRRPGRPARPVTREQLLRVAREAFAELGYAGASMGDIAERSGIRKSSLFHHFATKDELYKEALTGVVNEVEAKVREALGKDGSLLERLDRANLAVQLYFGETSVAARMILRELVGDGSDKITLAGDAVDMFLNVAVESLDKAMAEGKFPKQDARHLALSIAGVHLLFFAVPDVSTRCLGADAFDPAVVSLRAKEVCRHVRRLIGAPVE